MFATTFRELLDTATVAELRKRTEGTKWNNEQLLFHMLFGYLLVRNLRFLVWGFSRLPDNVSRRFAALLNAGTRPFHVINYVGSLFGARVLGYARMERLMDRVLSSLQASLRGESETALVSRVVDSFTFGLWGESGHVCGPGFAASRG